MFLVITTQHHTEPSHLTSQSSLHPQPQHKLMFSRYFTRTISSRNAVWYQSSVIDSNWLHYKTGLLGKYGHLGHLTAEENISQIEFEVVQLFLLLLLLLTYFYFLLLHHHQHHQQHHLNLPLVGLKILFQNKIYSQPVILGVLKYEK